MNIIWKKETFELKLNDMIIVFYEPFDITTDILI